MARKVTIRKTTLAELDDSFDREFWAQIPPDERFAEAWRLSEELYQLSGKAPDESGLPRAVARVIRR